MAEHTPANADSLPSPNFSNLYSYFTRHQLNLGDFAGDQAGLEQGGPYVADFIIELTIAREGQTTFAEEVVLQQLARLSQARWESRAGFTRIARPAFWQRAVESAAEVPEIRLLQALIADMHEKSPDATFLAENVLVVYGSLKHPSSEQLLQQARQINTASTIGKQALSSRPT